MPEFSRFTRSATVLLVAPLVAWGVVQLMVGVFVSGGDRSIGVGSITCQLRRRTWSVF